MSKLTAEEVDKIQTRVLADKHGCSTKYVRLVLLGKRKATSPKAAAIMKDGLKLIQAVQEVQL